MKKPRAIIFFLLSISVNAQTDSLPPGNVKMYPGWTLWVPGAAHFYDNNIIEGLLFSGIEIGAVAVGLVYDNTLKPQNSTPYYNFPLLLGMQAYGIDKCHWLKNRLEAMHDCHPGFRYDPITFNQLLKAPFQPKYGITSITGGFALLAIAELCFGGWRSHKSIRDVDKMYFAGRPINRNPALAAYGTVSLAASYGAGIGEEYCFRNGFLPLWDYRYGETKGLIYSSILFGLMHFSNLFFYDKPDYEATLLQVAEATIAGYFLGRDVQKRGHCIGPAVAAHMWYDFILMFGSFLIDPENNYLGVTVKFKV